MHISGSKFYLLFLIYDIALISVIHGVTIWIVRDFEDWSLLVLDCFVLKLNGIFVNNSTESFIYVSWIADPFLSSSWATQSEIPLSRAEF